MTSGNWAGNNIANKNYILLAAELSLFFFWEAAKRIFLLKFSINLHIERILNFFPVDFQVKSASTIY